MTSGACDLGVEAGQPAYVAVVMALSATIRRRSYEFPRWFSLIPSYAIGGVAMIEVVQRISSL